MDYSIDNQNADSNCYKPDQINNAWLWCKSEILECLVVLTVAHVDLEQRPEVNKVKAEKGVPHHPKETLDDLREVTACDWQDCKQLDVLDADVDACRISVCDDSKNDV